MDQKNSLMLFFISIYIGSFNCYEVFNWFLLIDVSNHHLEYFLMERQCVDLYIYILKMYFFSKYFPHMEQMEKKLVATEY